MGSTRGGAEDGGWKVRLDKGGKAKRTNQGILRHLLRGRGKRERQIAIAQRGKIGRINGTLSKKENVFWEGTLKAIPAIIREIRGLRIKGLQTARSFKLERIANQLIPWELRR